MNEVAEHIQKNESDYPIILEPYHIKEILGIGLRQTYEFLHDAPFHVAKVGRQYKVSREIFFRWLKGTSA